MKNFFKHQTKQPQFILYVKEEDEILPIKFYEKESPYSGSISPQGSRYPIEIESRHIRFDTIENATKMDKISEFIKWSSNAKKELEKFLNENNININDINILKINYPEPVEEILNLDLDVLI